MKTPFQSFGRREFVVFGFLCVTLLGAKGCDSTYIGVQDYGSVVGNVVDQAGLPIANAFVRITGTTTTSNTDPKGGFLIQHVAVGQQTVTVYAAGYNAQATLDVIVKKDETASAGNLQLQSTTAPQQLQRRTPAPAPVPSTTGT